MAKQLNALRFVRNEGRKESRALVVNLAGAINALCRVTTPVDLRDVPIRTLERQLAKLEAFAREVRTARALK